MHLVYYKHGSVMGLSYEFVSYRLVGVTSRVNCAVINSFSPDSFQDF